MNDQQDRRAFLKIGATAGAACMMGPGSLAAEPLAGEARPIEDVRVAVVGVGNRGTFLLKLLLEQEGVKVKAVCDLVPQRVARAQDMVTAVNQPKPTGYSRGETDFKRLCEDEELDLVVNWHHWNIIMRASVILLATLALMGTVNAQPPSARYQQIKREQQIKRGDLESNLRLLNLWDQKPEAVQQLYATAYNVLASRRNAGFRDLATDATFQSLCREQGVTHLGGPMLGAVTPDSVRVWLRTCRPAKVEVRVTVDGDERAFGPVSSTLASELVAIVPVTSLAPDTRYPYRVLVDGQPISIPKHAAITTTSATPDSAQVRIVFGTCFHRWGLGNPMQVNRILARNPTAMLLGGDIAVQDRNNDLGMHRADYLLRDFHPAWQSLVSTVPVYATWDDHDYFDNDKAGIPRGFTQSDKEGVCDVFCQAWNNPSYGFGDARRGIFFRTRIGPCDVIMLDHRYFRSGERGSFLGKEQMAWLTAQLLACEGPFIILSCGTMWSDYVSNGKDSWGRWDPAGREQIFRLIEKNQIGGVLLISGDRHGARGFRIPRPSGYSFYEFEAGSLGGRKGPPATKPQWKDVQLFGIAGQYAFGEFSIDATARDPEVTFRLIRDDGIILYEQTLTRSQLTPKSQSRS
jgi:alkaline phosphatase D